MVMAPMRLAADTLEPTVTCTVPEPSPEVGVIEIQESICVELHAQVELEALTANGAEPPAEDVLEVSGTMVNEQAVPNCVSV